VTGPCRTSRSEDSEVGHIRLFTGRTTISSVATGPRNREISHHPNPLRPLPWANPAFISDSVPQPIAPLLAFKISLSFESSVGRWSCQRVHGLRGYLSRWSQAEPVRLLEQRPIIAASRAFAVVPTACTSSGHTSCRVQIRARAFTHGGAWTLALDVRCQHRTSCRNRYPSGR
jgi:hypothetical protein